MAMGIPNPQSPGTGKDPLSEALAGRTQHVVHITHNDLDAAGCDAIHRIHYRDIFTIWCSVGKFLPILDRIVNVPGNGDLLSITDLGYQEGADERIAALCANGWRVVWRDHHRWQDEEIGSVEGIVETLNLDTETCATGIVARDLLPEDPTAREITGVVCDYDLWRHTDPRSKVLGQVVMQNDFRDYIRDRLMEGIFSDPAIDKRYADINREMLDHIEKSRQHAIILGKKYRIVFAPLFGYPSETAHALRESLDSDIEVVVSSNGRFSIRSVPPISHLIAREFGGGGHPNAAGGSFSFGFFDRLRFFLFKRTRHYERLIAVAERL
jgi:oligoribonuclease NrnB/cAMP/cGMP phosphodiesterase (DHH superfamily)